MPASGWSGSLRSWSGTSTGAAGPGLWAGPLLKSAAAPTPLVWAVAIADAPCSIGTAKGAAASIGCVWLAAARLDDAAATAPAMGATGAAVGAATSAAVAAAAAAATAWPPVALDAPEMLDACAKLAGPAALDPSVTLDTLDEPAALNSPDGPDALEAAAAPTSGGGAAAPEATDSGLEAEAAAPAAPNPEAPAAASAEAGAGANGAAGVGVPGAALATAATAATAGPGVLSGAILAATTCA